MSYNVKWDYNYKYKDKLSKDKISSNIFFYQLLFVNLSIIKNI